MYWFDQNIVYTISDIDKFCRALTTNDIATTSNLVHYIETHPGKYKEYKNYLWLTTIDPALQSQSDFIKKHNDDQSFYGINHTNQRGILSSLIRELSTTK